MASLVLDSEELSWLLGALHAKSVVGLEAPALFPADAAAQEATWETGLKKLQEHGWMVPASGAGQWHLNDDLTWLVAVLADPELVLMTIRSASKTDQRVLLHYLADETIVELTVVSDRQYGLGVVPDRQTLWSRIGGMLGLSEHVTASSETPFATEAQTLVSIQQLVADGQTEKAATLLRNGGVARADEEALLKALGAVTRGEMGVVHAIRAQGGRAQSGRKATLIRQAEQAWLVHRSQDGAALTVEPVQDGTLGKVVGPYLVTEQRA
jgi:hypothetical protein